jgi:hypothetical protein
MIDVATFWDSGADVPNGNGTAITVANPMIQPKNICGRGVVSMSRCIDRRGDQRGRGGRSRVLRGGRVAPRAVLLRPEQRAVPVAACPEVAPQQEDRARVIEEDGAAAASLARYGDVLIVAGQVEIADVDRQGLADALSRWCTAG